jgi:hypothetical protein
MIRAASPLRHKASVAHGFWKTELRRRRAGPYSSTDGRQISECLSCAVLSSCFVLLAASDRRDGYRQRFLPSEPAAGHDDRSAAASF